MQTQEKKVLYLQRQISKHAGVVSAMPSVTGFFHACGVAYMPAAYQPRERSIMALSSACKGFDSGKWHAAFLVPQRQNLTQMKNTKTTAGETANSITFKAEWLDFTSHLTNV